MELTGVVLNAPQQKAMHDYFRKGGNYVGVHSASACLYDDKVYEEAVGAHFDYHPKLQEAVSGSTVLLGLSLNPSRRSGYSTTRMSRQPTCPRRGAMYVPLPAS